MDLSTITLGSLLSHPNETIKRNAMSILKQLQRIQQDRELSEIARTKDLLLSEDEIASGWPLPGHDRQCIRQKDPSAPCDCLPY